MIFLAPKLRFKKRDDCLDRNYYHQINHLGDFAYHGGNTTSIFGY
jgi:hypothetical protein